MDNFFESELCKGGTACRKCRRSREYRRGIIASFEEPCVEDFECPRGKTAGDFPQDIEPSIFEMGINFFKTMGNEVKERAKAKVKRQAPPAVSNEEQQARIQKCRDREFFVNNKRCSKCGCFINFKSRLRAGRCPIGKW